MSSDGKIKLDLRVGFIGGGNMAIAIVKGLVSSGSVKADNIIIGRCKQNYLSEVKEIGCRTTRDNLEVIRHSDVVVISVKPHIVFPVLQEVAPEVDPDKHLVVSVAAGVTVDFLERNLPPKSRVVRTVPNTPSLVRTGASGMTLGHHVHPGDSDLVHALLSTVGICELVPEHLLDAINGVCGSGPAYCYVAMEALADGGVKMGLPRDLALKLAAQTLTGAGRMVLETGKHPGQLKDEVCSPGGTTIAAIDALEKNKFRSALIEAVEASTLKSRQMSSSN